MNAEFMTPQQQEIVGLLHDVQMKELAPLVREYDEKGDFAMVIHDKLGELGFHGIEIPEKYGGLGLDPMTRFLVREELGYVDIGFGFSYALGKGTHSTILRVGTEEQKKYICDRVLNGAIGCNCLTEPDAGSDASALRTTAVKVGDEYIINGRKCFITNAPIADFFLVVAYTDKSKGSKGISLFLVEKGTEGLSVGAHEDKGGFRTSLTSDVILEDVKVPASAMVGAEGEGYRAILTSIGEKRIVNYASLVGLMQAATDHAVAYTKQRVQFGKPVCQHQGVQFMLADMEIMTQASRQYLLYGVQRIERGLNCRAVASGAKVFSSDSAVRVTENAVQCFGGYGCTKDYPVDKLYRDAKAFQIFEGTNQINRMVLGRELTK